MSEWTFSNTRWQHNETFSVYFLLNVTEPEGATEKKNKGALKLLISALNLIILPVSQRFEEDVFPVTSVTDPAGSKAAQSKVWTHVHNPEAVFT